MSRIEELCNDAVESVYQKFDSDSEIYDTTDQLYRNSSLVGVITFFYRLLRLQKPNYWSKFTVLLCIMLSYKGNK